MFLKKDIADIEKRYQQLSEHNIFASIRTLTELHLFMQWHVFAVWDFMSLAKRLQQDLSTTQLPWVPSASPLATRLINEIVLGEESDELPDGGYLSHYEMYLLAMEEIGANTQQIKHFVQHLIENQELDTALVSANTHFHIQKFVKHTIEIATHGNIYQVLGNFFFARENVIPTMFSHLLRDWHISEEQAPMFVYYLKRHIELDADSHGPAVWKIIHELTDNKPDAIYQLKQAANDAIEHRIQLWDGLLETINNTHSQADARNERATG